MIDSILNYVDVYDKQDVIKEDKDEVELSSVTDEYQLNQLISNINMVDLMATLKEESYTNTEKNTEKSKKNELSQFTNKCEMNSKFKNKVFLDWNKQVSELYNDDKSSRFIDTITALKIPGLNRYLMPFKSNEA